MFITNAVDLYADGLEAVKVVDADERRTSLNISAGTTPLFWGGNRKVKAGTVSNAVIAGGRFEIKTSAEVWVIRQAGDAGTFGFSEEFTGDGPSL